MIDVNSLPIKMRIVVNGIAIKLSRGEKLETILTSYVKLTEEQKNTIREVFAEQE